MRHDNTAFNGVSGGNVYDTVCFFFLPLSCAHGIVNGWVGTSILKWRCCHFFSLANCFMGLVLTPRELEGGFDIPLGCSAVVE